MGQQEKYFQIIKSSLRQCHDKQFPSGWGYKLVCPFCSDVQKREGKKNERCAYLFPVEGSPFLHFECSRGRNGGRQGLVDCSKRMRFDTFLKNWNPPLYRKYVAEREALKKNYKPDFKQEPQAS